jgi:mannose-6-phosphate isomerase-like protein (cupin superfamily)
VPVYHNQIDSLPAGTERLFRTIIPAGTGGTFCSLHENVLVANAIIPLHYHTVVEVLICLDGTAECSLSGAAVESYERASVVVIPANTPHTIRNTGSSHLRQLSLLAVESPNTQWLEAPGSVDHIAP